MPKENLNNLFGSLLNDEEQKISRLDQLKKLMISAGYADELKKYDSDEKWIAAACKAGVLRDGSGNTINLPANATAQNIADTMAAVNGAFYIAEKDTGSFKKFGNNGDDGYMGLPYNTPPRISRPNFLLRMLDYFGFDIPSVKEYNKQMESVKGNPLYYKLHSSAARDASKDFVVETSKMPMPVAAEEKAAEEKAAEEKAAEEKAAEEKTTEEKAAEEKAAEEKAAEEKAEADSPEKKSLKNEDAEVKAEPPVQTEEQKADPEKKAPVEKAEEKPAPAKEEIAVSVEEADGKIKITMADGSVKVFTKQAAEKTEIAEEDVNSKEQKKEVASESVSEKNEAKAEEAAPEEKKSEEKAEEKKTEQKDTEQIDKKIYALMLMAKDHPEDSFMGIAIRSARQALEELKKTGLPEDRSAPDHTQRFNAVKKAASALLLVDRLDEAIKLAPDEQKKQLLAGGKKTEEVERELEKLTSSVAVERTLYNNPADKMRKLLTDDTQLAKFEKAMARELKNNPNGNLIPLGAIVHGSVYKVPGKHGWQRLPGAKEEDVKKSLDELSAMKPDQRIFKKIAKAEENIPVLKNRENEKSLKDRITEMRELTEKYPEGSVMKLLGTKATEALAELEKAGLPENSRSPMYAQQQEALKKATAAVCAYEHFEKKTAKLQLDKPNDPEAAELVAKMLDHYENHKLIGTMAGTSAAQLTDDLVNKKISERGLAAAMRREERERKEQGIPVTAERKGSLYRMNPKEGWKQVPGATLKEVNDSLLRVMDEKQDMLLASLQKEQENIHFSDATLSFGV